MKPRHRPLPRGVLALLATPAAIVALTMGAHAQTVPNAPVTLVIAEARGSATDEIARQFARRLAARMLQAVEVDNRTGISSTAVAAQVARSSGEGLSLLLVQAPWAVGIDRLRTPPNDPWRELTPVTKLAAAPLVMAVHPTVQAGSVRELIALARARPATLRIGAAAPGSIDHRAATLFALDARIRTLRRPDGGQAPADLLAGLLAGDTDIGFVALPVALPLARRGRLRLLALTSAERSPLAPEIPAIAEAGVRGFDLRHWYGLLAPGSTPRAQVRRLQEESAQVLGEPDFRQRLAAEGLSVVASSPEAFAQFLSLEAARATRIARAAKADPGPDASPASAGPDTSGQAPPR